MTSARTIAELETGQWRDKKRHLWLMGLIAPTALFVCCRSSGRSTSSAGTPRRRCSFWIGPILLYILLPALDLRFGPDGQNPPDEVMERLENDKYYRYCTYIFIPFQYASVIFGAYLFTASDLSWLGYRRRAGLGGQDRPGADGRRARRDRHQHRPRAGPQEGLAGALAVARSPWRRPATATSTSSTTAATTSASPPRRIRRRPAFGETFWEFLPRSVWGSLRRRGSWRPSGCAGGQEPVALVQRRAQRLGDVGRALRRPDRGVRPGAHPVHRHLRRCSASRCWRPSTTSSTTACCGRRPASGRYERCAPEHSWNSDHIVTNLFLYHLQRHSDHHANPTRRYQTLRSMDGAPEPAQRLRVDDRADLLPAAVAQGDGPPGARALRRRHHPGQHRSRAKRGRRSCATLRGSEAAA